MARPLTEGQFVQWSEQFEKKLDTLMAEVMAEVKDLEVTISAHIAATAPQKTTDKLADWWNDTFGKE